MEGTPFVSPEGPVGRGLRRAGMILFLSAALLPFHTSRYVPYPPLRWFTPVEDYPRSRHFPDVYDNEHPHTVSVCDLVATDSAPIVGTAYPEAWRFPARLRSLAIDRQDYWRRGDPLGVLVFLLAAVWLPGLLVAGAVRSARWRFATGVVLWMGIGAFFLFLLLSFSPRVDLTALPWFGIRPGIVVGFALGSLLLLFRPRGRRSIEDIDSHVSAQALVGILVCLSMPVVTFLERNDAPFRVVSLDGLLLCLRSNYRSGFWLALSSMACMALPLYVGEARLRRFLGRLPFVRLPPPEPPPQAAPPAVQA